MNMIKKRRGKLKNKNFFSLYEHLSVFLLIWIAFAYSFLEDYGGGIRIRLINGNSRCALQAGVPNWLLIVVVDVVHVGQTLLWHGRWYLVASWRVCSGGGGSGGSGSGGNGGCSWSSPGQDIRSPEFVVQE